MVLTIPGGIILMGAVMGITKGLERGLAKRVEMAIMEISRSHDLNREGSRRTSSSLDIEAIW